MKALLAFTLSPFFALSMASADTATPLVPSGDTLVSSSVGERVITSENSQKASEEIRVQYPEISRDILTLFTIDRVVLTSNGTLDLYQGETLWMTLERQDQTFAVRQSAYTFAPASIEHTMSVQKPDQVANLDFVFKGCTTPQGQAQACEMVRVHLELAEIVVAQ